MHRAGRSATSSSGLEGVSSQSRSAPPDGGLDGRGVGQVNAVDGPASLLLAIGEQLADPEVAVRRGDDAAAGRHEVEHRGDRGHAGGEGHGVTALHLAHGCLERLPARRGVCA